MTTTPKKPDPIDVHVGRRVRIRRVLQGLSQSALAEQLELTFQQLQKYEKGTNRISASKLWRIAQALDAPIAWFFEGIDDDNDDTADMPTKREQLELARHLANLPPAIRSNFGSLARTINQYSPPPAAE